MINKKLFLLLYLNLSVIFTIRVNSKELIMNDFVKPINTVDPVIFTLHDNKLKILLILRDKEPFIGKYTLPGGWVHANEGQDLTIEDTVKRVLKEKTGVDAPYFEQLNTFGSHNRDPRGWSISIVYISLIPWHSLDENLFKDNAKWVDIESLNQYELGFDHNSIIDFALQRIRNKVNYSILPVYFLPEKFTQTDLQKVYELVLGTKLDKSAFRKKIAALNFLEDTGERDFNVSFRPPLLFKVKETALQCFRSNFI